MSQKLEALFRPKYRELSQVEKDQIDRIKTGALELSKSLYPTDSPEKTLALRKLQECVFWATYAITS